VHLAPAPGTDVALLLALAHTIVFERLHDASFIGRRVTGFEEFSRHTEVWSPERAAGVCGVDPVSIRRAARLYATGGPAVSFHGLGLTEQAQGTDGVAALVDLALLTGNIGRPGTGVNPLRGQNNVQGAAHMGCDPGMLPGAAPIRTAHGLTLMQMIDAAAACRLKALWAIGYDVLLTSPNASATRRALAGLELMIVQDIFLTETAREVAHVFLPACSSFEKEGTFMNAERRIQRVRTVVPPPGEARPDWRILCDAARAMGAPGFEFGSPREIWDEVRSRCEGARGMSYDRLDSGGLQWPCPDEAHPGTATLHAEAFPSGPTAALRLVEPLADPEQTGPEYPFVLVTGRLLYQFNAGTMTRRTPNQELRPADLLDVSPDDADALGLREGDRVMVTSRYGRTVLPARITPEVRPGELFTTFHTSEAFVNAITSPHRDPVTDTPAYKRTAVRLERLDGNR
jgi:formate dehydrogenase major subunit